MNSQGLTLLIGLLACAFCLDENIINSHNLRSSLDCPLGCLNCENTASCNYCIGDNFYMLENGQCFECPTGCAKCQNSTSCDLCYSFHYKNNTTGECLECPSGCEICKDGNSCDSCFGENFYASSTGECLECLPGCKSCKNGISCDTCYNRMYYSSATSKCIKCEFDHYLENEVCFNCHKNCSLCPQFTDCYKCEKGMYFDNPVCRNCSQDCSKCYNNCISCQSEVACDVCVTGFVGPKCDTCPLGYFYNQTCMPCSNKCEKCSSSETCERCFNGFQLNNSQCLELKSCITENDIISKDVSSGYSSLKIILKHNIQSIPTSSDCQNFFTLESIQNLGLNSICSVGLTTKRFSFKFSNNSHIQS